MRSITCVITIETHHMCHHDRDASPVITTETRHPSSPQRHVTCHHHRNASPVSSPQTRHLSSPQRRVTRHHLCGFVGFASFVFTYSSRILLTVIAHGSWSSWSRRSRLHLAGAAGAIRGGWGLRTTSGNQKHATRVAAKSKQWL